MKSFYAKVENGQALLIIQAETPEQASEISQRRYPDEHRNEGLNPKCFYPLPALAFIKNGGVVDLDG